MQPTLFTPKVVSSFDEEFLAYGTQDGDIYIRTLPTFKLKLKLALSKMERQVNNLPIKCFDFSNDSRSIFYWQ